MSPKNFYAMALALLLICPLKAKAATYYVGTCHAGSFAKISDAINSSKVAPGSIVKVCPGDYVEQVIISKPLTLEGTPGAGTVLIYWADSPKTAVSPISNTSFIPTVWITAGPVKIQDIGVTDEFSVPGNQESVGFYFATGAFGTLSHVSSQQSYVGASIWVENANLPETSVAIENSYLDNGIVALAPLQPAGQSPLLGVTITGNEITPNISSGNNLGNGIYLYEVKGAVTGNFISGPNFTQAPNYKGVGIWDQSPDATVSGNNISFVHSGSELPHGCGSFGIVVASDKVSVKSNKISGTQCGIDLGCHVGTVSGNTVNRAIIGLIDVSSSFSGANTFHIVDETNDVGSCK